MNLTSREARAMARDIELARAALMRSVRRLTAAQVVQRLEGVVECSALLRSVLGRLDDVLNAATEAPLELLELAAPLELEKLAVLAEGVERGAWEAAKRRKPATGEDPR